MATESGYDVFISYSHRHDPALGPALQAKLQRFAKPWFRLRALRIFCDTANLAASPALWAAIQDSLESSRWFMLLASPDAAASAWVNREVEWWLANRPLDRLLVAATAPGLAWDEERNNWADGAPVPPALIGAFPAEPRWVDLSDVQYDRRAPLLSVDKLADIAAPVRGVPKDTLVGEHLREHRHAMRLAWSAAGVLTALTIVAVIVGLFAIGQRDTANSERNHAVSERNLAVADAFSDQSEATGGRDPVLARLEAVAAWNLEHNPRAGYAMLNAAVLPDDAVLPGVDGVSVASLAFSPDGKTLAASTDNLKTLLWNVAARKLTVTLPDAAGNHYAGPVAFSPDGKILAAGTDLSVRLWDVATRRLIATLPGGGFSVAFSPDGKTLAAAALDGIRLWNVADHQLTATLPENSSTTIYSMAFNPAGRILATSTGSDQTQLWNIATRKLDRALPAGGTQSTDAPLMFSPDGKTLAIGAGRGTQLWNIATGRLLVTLPSGDGNAGSLAFSPDGETLAAGTASGAQLWDTATRQLTTTITPDPGASVVAVTFSPDGTTLATATADGNIELCDMAKEAEISRPLAILPHAGDSYIGTAALSPDGKTLAAVDGYTGGTQLWNIATGQVTATLPVAAGNGVTFLAFNPDGKTLAVGLYNGGTQLWDMGTRKVTATLPDRNARVTSLAFNPDGRTLAVGTTNDGTQVWNVANRKLTFTIGISYGGEAVAFSPDSKILAVGAGIYGTQLWDIATRKLGATLPLSTGIGGTDSLAFSADGDTLAVGISNGGTQLWDIATRKQTTIPFSAGADSAVAYGPGGTVLAFANNYELRLWDPAAGQQVITLIATSDQNSGPVDVAISRDGTLMAVTMANGTVQLWRTPYLADTAGYVCALANQPFPVVEWAQNAPGVPYQGTCP